MIKLAEQKLNRAQKREMEIIRANGKEMEMWQWNI